MRKLNINKNDYTEVFAVDEAGPGNANHVYDIRDATGNHNICQPIVFQNGPIKESGVNGIQNEDLIAIIIDRLQGFQRGEFACKDNGMALVNLHGAMAYLRQRTKKREDRGVEGTSEK